MSLNPTGCIGLQWNASPPLLLQQSVRLVRRCVKARALGLMRVGQVAPPPSEQGGKHEIQKEARGH